MTHPRLTAAARRGDERAIAELVQAALPEGNRSSARLQHQVLELILTAPHRLNQEQTLISVADVLRSLKLNLQQIQIAAFIRHETSPIWREVIDFAPQSKAQRVANQDPASGANPARSPTTNQRSSAPGIPAWLAEKPNFHTYRRLLEQHFDLMRLGLLLPFGLYALFFAKHYNVSDFINDPPAIMRFIHGVNLIFHEAGHILFMPFGRFMTILGGSLNQILIPAVIAGYFGFKGQKYSGAITLFWVGENFWDVSIYASDGRDAILPLLGGGDTDSHDWLNLLSMMGITDHAKLVGSCLYAVGTLIYISAIGLTIYFSQKPIINRIRE
jgi:hypothetical protein